MLKFIPTYFLYITIDQSKSRTYDWKTISKTFTSYYNIVFDSDELKVLQTHLLVEFSEKRSFRHETC